MNKSEKLKEIAELILEENDQLDVAEDLFSVG